MKHDSFQIPQPSKIRVASITPFWRINEFLAIIKNFFIKNGTKLQQEISKELKDIHNIPFEYCYFFDSGRSAIYFSLISLGLKKGDKVIIPSFTCRALLFALFEAGVEPIFGDIDEDYNLDLKSLVFECDLKDVKAIIIPNMFGKMNCEYELLKKLKTKGIIVIEDNATSFGTSYDSEILSDALIYSFNLGKMINGSGGGLVYMRHNVSLDEFNEFKSQKRSKVVLRFLRELVSLRFRKQTSVIISFFRRRINMQKSLDDYYSFKDKVSNETQKYFKCKKISFLSLILICSQIKDYERIRLSYNKLFNKYNSKLGLKSKFKKNEVPNYFLIEINKKIDRYELGSYLSNYGIETYWSYYPIHRIKIYEDILRINKLDTTNKKWSNFLYLPFNLFISEENIDFVCEKYKEYIESYEESK
ncbi:DegT/DnrJ/EryC1/StrS family aminotransferase [Pseudothioglobus sp. nBUS_23]|uniref:DegT/DnrJ/EryC1/StrS family aminotransferase n=1 Tax=Pseudothioglobus sp. nBUS_23 TaxID=3395318 RepID=UPI003EBEE766